MFGCEGLGFSLCSGFELGDQGLRAGREATQGVSACWLGMWAVLRLEYLRQGYYIWVIGVINLLTKSP